MFPDFIINDGTDRIFICAGGDRDDVSPDMKSFIDYLVGKAAKSDLTSKIEAKVKDAIEKRLWRKEYITYKEQMDLEYQKGIEEGIEKGIEKGATMNLITLIIRKMGKGKTIEDIAEDLDGNIEDIRRIYLAAEEFTPDYDVEKIYDRLKKGETDH